MRLLVAAALLVSLPASAGERLVLIGGGTRPPEVLAPFVEWAGAKEARILVIAWASGEPQGSFEAIRTDLLPFHPASVEAAPLAPLDTAAKSRFLEQLRNASGVFFTGGQQDRIMTALEDASLLRALRERYHAGVVFGGTSAGTAAMSERMITGDGDFTVIDGDKVETRPGLGLLPGVILDQHFIKRQRENRLFGLVLKHPHELGVGIDEATALLVEDGRRAEVVGQSQVVLVEAQKTPGSLLVTLLEPGRRFDLDEHRSR